MSFIQKIFCKLTKVPTVSTGFFTRKNTTDNNPQEQGPVQNIPSDPISNVRSRAIIENSEEEETFRDKLSDLWEISEDFQALQAINNILYWDTYTVMPSKSQDFRSWQFKALNKLMREKLSSDTTHSMIEYFLQEENHKRLNEREKALFREIYKEYNKINKIPPDVAQELIDVTAEAYKALVAAREADDFNLFTPALDKVFQLKRQIAENVGYENSPYDVFLEEYEPGLTTQSLKGIYAELKSKLVPMLKKINKQSANFKRDFLFLEMSPEEQLQLGKQVLEDTGYDLSKGRLDLALHSFSLGIAPNDIRLALSPNQNIFHFITLVLHEGKGHGNYNIGLPSNFAKTPLYDAASLSMHEAQAQIYEIMIGHNLPFWQFYYPKLKEQFPEHFKGVSLDDFYKAINYVEPPKKRTDDDYDDITHLLSYIVCSEVEEALIEGNIETKDFPAHWNQLVKEYLGVDDNDVPWILNYDYWITDSIGYVPTYILGILYAAQIFAAAKKANPHLEEEIVKGDFSKLDKWLKENVYKYGKVKSADEVLRLATGEGLNIDYFIEYIREKYSKIYNIAL